MQFCVTLARGRKVHLNKLGKLECSTKKLTITDYQKPILAQKYCFIYKEINKDFKFTLSFIFAITTRSQPSYEL